MSLDKFLRRSARRMAILNLAILVSSVSVLSPAAAQARDITWEDLSPAPSPSDDPLAGLTTDQLDLVLWVLGVLETEPVRNPENEAVYAEIDQAMPIIRETGIDLDQVLEARKEAGVTVVGELDGEQVRMPGYLLPLELRGTEVTEFLLVPYVGACIHVPPPPANQIVHVRLAENESYQSTELFEPVWVTGVLSTTATVKELYLVDGSADIDTGYSIVATLVEPYR